MNMTINNKIGEENQKKIDLISYYPAGSSIINKYINTFTMSITKTMTRVDTFSLANALVQWLSAIRINYFFTKQVSPSWIKKNLYLLTYVL